MTLLILGFAILLQWGGLHVDPASPDVLEPASLCLSSDSPLWSRIQSTLTWSRSVRPARELSGNNADASPLTTGVGHGLPLHDQPAAKLSRHRVETAALGLHSIDATPRMGTPIPTTSPARSGQLKRSKTVSSLGVHSPRVARPLSARADPAAMSDSGFWPSTPVARRPQELSLESTFLPAISPVTRSPVAKFAELHSGRSSASAAHIAADYHLSALSGSPGKPQWASSTRLAFASHAQTRVDIARVASESTLGTDVAFNELTSSAAPLQAIPRTICLSYTNAGSPKAVERVMHSIASTEAQRKQAVESLWTNTAAAASLAQSYAKASAAARMKDVLLLDSSDEDADAPSDDADVIAARDQRARSALARLEEEALVDGLTKFKLVDPSERMSHLKPVREVVLRESGMNMRWGTVLCVAWCLCAWHAALASFSVSVSVCAYVCSGCAAMVESWRSLGPALSSIAVLDLSKNAIGASGIKLLADGLAVSRFALLELMLEDVDMRDVGLSALVEVRALSLRDVHACMTS